MIENFLQLPEHMRGVEIVNEAGNIDHQWVDKYPGAQPDSIRIAFRRSPRSWARRRRLSVHTGHAWHAQHPGAECQSDRGRMLTLDALPPCVRISTGQCAHTPDKCFPARAGYQNMCRWNLMGLMQHPRIQELEYYCRMDTHSYVRSPLGYDVFDFVAARKLKYAFVAVEEEAAHVMIGAWRP